MTYANCKKSQWLLLIALLFATALNASDSAIPDQTKFVDGSLAEDITTVECALSDGTKTTCYRITVVGAPADDESPEGPYCPPNINSTAEAGGKWIDGKGTVYDVDGKFIENLSTLYNDERWQMYDPITGEATIISGAEGCKIAGNPTADPGYDYFCFECRLANMDGGIQQTIVIPTNPVKTNTNSSFKRRQNIGVALNGVLFGPPAPLELIISSYTLGVFDDCDGHGNPREGYHYHATTGCAEIGKQADGHGALMGYALDGFGIYARLDDQGNAPEGLHECGGQTDDVRGYRYHTSAPGDNEIISCFAGAQGFFGKK